MGQRKFVLPRRFLLSLGVLSIATAVQATAGAHAQHHHGHHHGHHHELSPQEQQAIQEQFLAATPAQGLSVEQCWLRLIPAGLPAAGYFVLSNHKEQPVELLAVRSDSYEQAMLHQTYEEDGLSKMGAVDELVIAAGQSLSFEPGGFHAMFEMPTQALKVGDHIEIMFLFSSAERLDAQCRVLPAKARSYDEQG